MIAHLSSQRERERNVKVLSRKRKHVFFGSYSICQRQNTGHESMRMMLDANDGNTRLIVTVFAFQARTHGSCPNIAVVLLHQAQHTVVDGRIAQRKTAHGFGFVFGNHLNDDITDGQKMCNATWLLSRFVWLTTILFTGISREPLSRPGACVCGGPWTKCGPWKNADLLLLWDSRERKTTEKHGISGN